MKKWNYFFLIIFLFGFLEQAVCQETERIIRIKKELYRLRDYSVAYDTYKLLSQKHPEFIAKRDSTEVLYRSQVFKIKQGTDRKYFLNFLTDALSNDSARYSKYLGFNYTMVENESRVRRRDLPTLYEYFKVVKYCLFDKDEEDLLPLDKIPFLSEKKDTKPRNIIYKREID